MDNLNKRKLQFLRDDLRRVYKLCTPKQQKFFDRIYPKGVSDSKLSDAINLCDRTIVKNLITDFKEK
jgi:hypothetical protein